MLSPVATSSPLVLKYLDLVPDHIVVVVLDEVPSPVGLYACCTFAASLDRTLLPFELSR